MILYGMVWHSNAMVLDLNAICYAMTFVFKDMLKLFIGHGINY